MKNLIFAATAIIFASILGSCDHDKRASEARPDDDKVDLAVIGNERCEIHQSECTEEEIEIRVMHGPSYPESYWEVRRSEEYLQAVKLNFPNANSLLPYAVPGTSYAKKEGGKMIHRFYCSECRQAEKIWHADKNKNAAEKAGDGDGD